MPCNRSLPLLPCTALILAHLQREELEAALASEQRSREQTLDAHARETELAIRQTSDELDQAMQNLRADVQERIRDSDQADEVIANVQQDLKDQQEAMTHVMDMIDTTATVEVSTGDGRYHHASATSHHSLFRTLNSWLRKPKPGSTKS